MLPNRLQGGFLPAQPHNTRYKYLDHSHFSYRLSALGWLSSQTLREDNTAFGDVGVGNYGMFTPQGMIKK
jgi:hypothetical protein